MWIRTMRRRGRSESLFVFEFTSIEEDYIPFIFHMEKIAALIPTEKCKAYCKKAVWCSCFILCME